jgi:hypothetical protein
MVIHDQPGRLRRNSDQPTAITNVLMATSGSSHRTGDIPLGIPTCSARSRHGRWALYPNGAESWSSGPAAPWPDRPPRSPVSSTASAAMTWASWTAPPSARSSSS